MQKIINVFAITSFVVSGAVVGGAGYVYLNKDALLDGVKGKITEAVMGSVGGALPDAIDGAMPNLPTSTGLPVPNSPL
jgi:hypothetical protein|tara:strand:- start:939 stop:1172 length:234 start_codon:yes stop_codon:yes gene_type:complete